MRLWSLHPSYIDARGLVALWREALLARKVLKGQTFGYRHHPQLIRFTAQGDPLIAIESYLWGVYEEALRRGYHFDVNKLGNKPEGTKMTVTTGQLQYEFSHLKGKLQLRDLIQYQRIASLEEPQAHPLFRVIPGDIEAWERTKEMKGSLPAQR